MFGSKRQPELVDHRQIVLDMPATMPAMEAATALNEFLETYTGDKAALMFGYWEYGDRIVVTAPTHGGLQCS